MEQDKKLKWENPKLVKLSVSKATGDIICTNGSGDVGGCASGTNGGNICTNGSGNVVAGCDVGTGGVDRG